ncbi:DUF4255 domain-containing protein [Massilia sp. P8910]|uniref:DUF4255 domain-containing protein n=1 Tax=Massilia antarctica TaxID=2765360 RepID=UPI0006BB779A|nr:MULTISPECIES: DUF4255 domain-containing protein [Massilia]MCE3603677.1 DUF4255 domain-containing protein [Massilia antarctica]MCY0916471.1 DUF4255 domain-containing protein [Massilia sp. H27-R4]CUI07402.1 Nitrogen regulation protein NR(I) [Janthinobacterium sp. CG23_2]CUU31188.1 Nitrogen regulation protein NR(I) [Janthinobacterium sp. CG23_2]
MSYHVILEVSKCLRHALWLGMKEEPDTGDLVNAELNIMLSNPAQPPSPNASRQMSLWLYQILPNEHLRNAPQVRVRDNGDDTVEFYPPLALNLLYLLTPHTKTDEGDQLVLGRSLQIFHDQSILRLESKQDPERAEELHVSLAPRTIEELAKVWEAMQQPYRLSVCYEVRVARIDSQRRQAGGRVAERAADFGQLAA